jgi:GNAT superfamily N-acetyltransferase
MLSSNHPHISVNKKYKKNLNILLPSFSSVIPTFRRHGVATILMEDAIQQCERWGNIQVKINFPKSSVIENLF